MTEKRSQDRNSVARLADLCRVWGAIKFIHPWSNASHVDWDGALLKAIPQVEKARSVEKIAQALDGMASVLKDPLTRCEPHNPPASARLHDSVPRPVDTRTEVRDGIQIAILTCPWEGFSYEQVLANSISAAAEAVNSADAFIIDLRGRREPSANDAGHWWQAYAFRQAVTALLTSDIPLPTRGRRYHSGYNSPSSLFAGYSYHSGVQVQRADVLPSKPGRHAGKPFVVIVDLAAYYSVEVLMGIQAAGVGWVVFVGEQPALLECKNEARIRLSSGLEFRMRTSELLGPERSTGFSPDAVVSSDAIEAATDLLRLRPSARPVAPPHPPAPNASAGRPEDDYPHDLPPRGLRLLALFRLWSVVDFFFPYKPLMDRPWDECLRRLIPAFLQADTPEAYGLAVLEAVSALNDSHGRANVGNRCQSLFGTHVPPVLLRTLAGSRVVTQVLDGECRIEVGDTVLSVDEADVEDRAALLARYTAASTKQSLDSQTNIFVLAGAQDSSAAIRVRKLSGRLEHVSVPRRLSAANVYQISESSLQRPRWRLLPEGFGYIDMVKLKMDEVEEAMAAVEAAPALILDVRGYPQGTAFAIAPMLTDRQFTIAQFRRNFVDGLRQDENRTQLCFEQTSEADGRRHYKGHIVVLIDERAVSHAEHSCLALEAAAPERITFVGTPTTGANGDVTELSLPGAVKVSFTGHDVRHADGRQLQRVGIQPDLWIEPTPEGLAAGRDEVLDAAVRFLQQKLGRA